MLHVRQIITPLIPQISQLLENGLLPPNIDVLFSCSKIIKYPPFVYNVQKKYKWGFSHFGIFTEELLRKMLTDDWKDHLYKLYLTTAAIYTNDDISKLVTKEDLYSCMGRFVNISKYIKEFSNKNIKYNHEYNYSVITGHPDIICNNGTEIYDVKTTTKFDSPTMKNNTILQISAYLALARESGRDPKICGVILPFQQTTLLYNLEYTEYDHKPFLALLVNLAKTRIPDPMEQIEVAMYMSMIGNHTKKIGGSIYKSLLDYYTDKCFTRPCQIFMRGNVSSKTISLKDDDITQSLNFIFQNNIKMFTHSPYIINLCHPCGNKTKDPKPVPWALNVLKEDLLLTNTVGGSGVVVHTGKGMHLNKNDAYNQMYISVLDVLDSATEHCPLLIETPVDKGTELCGTPESLSEFYMRFTVEQRERLKICIDTCHTYAAGYLPYDYICNFTKLVAIKSIALIHLNDAQWLQGSGHDGHAPVGKGCIGMTEMLKVIRWGIKNDVPMLCE